MSRNKEKAQSGLNRYYEQKIQDAGVITADPSNRPRRVQGVKSIAEAELWRKTILGEFLAKMSAINDPSLSDLELRDINDALNKIYNEKRAWEYHILSLGGNDYIRYEQKIGIRINGKTYFGRAKQLPEARVPEKIHFRPGSSNLQEQGNFSLNYYGALELSQLGPSIDASKEKIMAEINGAFGEKVFADAPLGGKPDTEKFTQKDVEKWLVERKKRELMAKLMQ